MNTELLKLRIFAVVQDLKISFYKQKFSFFLLPTFGKFLLTLFALATALSQRICGESQRICSEVAGEQNVFKRSKIVSIRSAVS